MLSKPVKAYQGALIYNLQMPESDEGQELDTPALYKNFRRMFICLTIDEMPESDEWQEFYTPAPYKNFRSMFIFRRMPDKSDTNISGILRMSIYEPQLYPRSSPAVKDEGQEFDTPATNKNFRRKSEFCLGY